ncbi:hypothetical protein GCM10017781_44970 [Deinococcus metalli]|uniref:Transposase n=1 Tax=Deinococcus metalli TaxID=1141878 RepID=A0ABQ3JW67_9DEIO|nr:hypothetical protein GCM10017781_44970 [Deinococcus metalli]
MGRPAHDDNRTAVVWGLGLTAHTVAGRKGKPIVQVLSEIAALRLPLSSVQLADPDGWIRGEFAAPQAGMWNDLTAQAMIWAIVNRW